MCRQQTVWEPTRGENLLDSSLCNNSDLVSAVHLHATFLTSDHCIIFFNVNLAHLNFPPLNFYDYRCTEQNFIHAFLVITHWNESFHDVSDSCKSVWTKFIEHHIWLWVTLFLRKLKLKVTGTHTGLIPNCKACV